MAYRSINPYSLEKVSEHPDIADADLDQVIARSHEAFHSDWGRRTVAFRAEVLRRAADMLDRDVDRHARTITLEMGKLIGEVRDEVRLTAAILRYYGENAERLLAPVPVDTGLAREATIVTRPLGPIFCIEPWNLPYYQLVRVAAPNLAAGNTVIAKPAPSVPASSLAFERLLHDAGAPSGVYQTVFASNEQAGRIVADSRVRGVALTGSERAGSAVAAEAGKALKKCTMELGGSNAFIIRDDADLDHAVKLAVQGRLMNTGQACAGSKRFIVHDSVADLFTRRFAAAMDSLVPGDPLDERTTLGPLVNEAAVKTILDQIDRAVAGGAQVVIGGRRLDRPGCFVDGHHPRDAAGQPRGPGGAVRAGRDGLPCARRRRGDPAWPTPRPSASERASSRATSSAPVPSPNRSTPAWCSSTATCSPRRNCRSAASRTPASAASCRTSASASSSTASS